MMFNIKLIDIPSFKRDEEVKNMMLVIPSSYVDKCTSLMREVQGSCVDVGDYVNARLLELAINTLQRESVDVSQSIVKGRRQILEEQ